MSHSLIGEIIKANSKRTELSREIERIEMLQEIQREVNAMKLAQRRINDLAKKLDIDVDINTLLNETIPEPEEDWDSSWNSSDC